HSRSLIKDWRSRTKPSKTSSCGAACPRHVIISPIGCTSSALLATYHAAVRLPCDCLSPSSFLPQSSRSQSLLPSPALSPETADLENHSAASSAGVIPCYSQRPDSRSRTQ